MYFKPIIYDLACRNCKSLRPTGISILQSDEDIEYLSREELIEEMDNFQNIQCANCGEYGNWLVLKIQLNDNDEVRDQFKINIFKENNKIYGKPENGYYSPAQIDIAFMIIRDKIEELEGHYYPSQPNGKAFIMVDFLKDEPFSRVSIFDIDGFSLEEVSGFIDALIGKKAPNGISNELKIKLENAFEDLKNDTSNLLVIAHLQSKDKEIDIYLIAKDPNEEIYYGIMENEFVSERQIASIPLSNIKAMEVEEVSMQPFRAKAYIETKTKIEINMSLQELFINDKDFQQKIIFIHFVKSKDYIASKANDLLFALGFSKGMNSIPVAIAITQSVIDFKVDTSGKIDFSYKRNFLGLPSITNIVELFPLLSKYCYKPTDSNHLLSLMENSNNGQLLAFGQTLRKRVEPKKLEELVEILNKPESNPNIQESSININELDKNLLILNLMAYENIFKKYITEEILAQYRKK